MTLISYTGDDAWDFIIDIWNQEIIYRFNRL